MLYIDLNMDAGESFGRWLLGDDEKALPHVSSANIACGLHAGDPLVMEKTMLICRENKVSPGAHPGFPDLQGFGRRNIKMNPKEIEAYVMYQVGALKVFAEDIGLKLSHVKAHGALYNMAAVDNDIAMALARGVARVDSNLILVGLAGSLMIDAADRVGIPRAREGFCDRAYNTDGTLLSREKPGSVIHDPQKAAERAVLMVKEGKVLTPDGRAVELQVDTICIHGDTPSAATIARTIRSSLEENGITVKSLAESR